MSELALPSFLNAFLNAPMAAVAVDSRMTFAQDVAYQSVGVIVVVGSLALIALLLVIFNRILRATGLSVSQPPLKNDPLPAGAGAANAEELPADLRAAIAAAVYTTLGSSHKIVEIRASDSVLLQAWSMEGRRQIFQSHKFR